MQPAKSELGFGEGQPIGIEYHSQGFQGSSQDLELMDSKSKFRNIRVEVFFFEKKFPLVLIVLISLHSFSDNAFVSATPIHPAIS